MPWRSWTSECLPAGTASKSSRASGSPTRIFPSSCALPTAITPGKKYLPSSATPTTCSSSRNPGKESNCCNWPTRSRRDTGDVRVERLHGRTPSVNKQLVDFARMNRLYRNPAAWLTIALFAILTFLFFRYFPIVASISYGGLILCVAARQTRFALRLRRQGYRVRGHGPETLWYEETASDGIRYLAFGYGSIGRGKVGIYWPSREAWQQGMPAWAKDRRDEILDRIRNELGGRLAKCIETDSVVA